ncbi:MAG: RHS repeat-associated core domain-containing protein [Gemmatimonadetes bacterium]|nr:RHS repeat-associated core domain-containing protein [Gemmatimonadota bacterium]
MAAILDPINGTVRGLARFRTGAKVKEFAEAPWGDAVADTGLVVRYHFAGREYDSESGLYMRARYYDPALGRWISEDPIGIAGGLNVYAYAGNDPVNGRDPSGLDPRCDLRKPPGTPGGCPLPMDTLEVFGDTGQNKGLATAVGSCPQILGTDCDVAGNPGCVEGQSTVEPISQHGRGRRTTDRYCDRAEECLEGMCGWKHRVCGSDRCPPAFPAGVFSVQRVAINDYFKIGPLRVKVLGGVGVYRGTYFGPVGPQALLMSLRAQAFVHCASGHAVFEGYAPTP